MKQQKLTELALRKLYHAENLGMPADLVKSMRDGVQELNAKIDHAAQFVDEELTMLGHGEKVVVLDRHWNEFVVQLAQLSLAISLWIRMRVSQPGGPKRIGVT